MARKRNSTEAAGDSEMVSTSAAKRSRTNGRARDLHDEDEISETESPDSSLKSIKLSASQKERGRPSLSQVPEDTIVVDLTQSSPAASPQNITATKEVRKNTRLSRGSSSAFKRAFEGLGERSMLKKKKRNSA